MPITGNPGMFPKSVGGMNLGSLISPGGSEGISYDDINTMLQQFGGVSMPGGAPNPMLGGGAQAPGGLFEGMRFAGQHPGLAHGLDNALIALANMGEPSPTIGGNISNVARGLESIGPTRRAQAMAGPMLGMQMAEQVGKLGVQKADIERMKAMADYYSGRNRTQSEIAQSRLQQAMWKQQLENQARPVLDRNGVVLIPTYNDETGKVELVPHPEIDPKSIQRQQFSKMLGGGIEAALTLGRAGPPPNPNEPDAPENKNWWVMAGNIYKDFKSAGAQVGAGGAKERQETGEWFQNQKTLFQSYLTGGTSAKIREDRMNDRATQLVMSENLPFDQAMARATQEAQAHKSRLMENWSNFSLMSEDQQRALGGINSYLQQQGYNPQNDSFESSKPSQVRSAPQTRTLSSPTPKPTATTAPTTKLSPAVQAIIDSLNASPK